MQRLYKTFNKNKNPALAISGFCALGAGTIAGGVGGGYFWKDVVWTAMANGGVDFTGRVCITVFGGGEASVAAGLALGFCGTALAIGVVAGLGWCAYQCLSGCGSKTSAAISNAASYRAKSSSNAPSDTKPATIATPSPADISELVTQTLQANASLLEAVGQLAQNKPLMTWSNYQSKRNELLTQLIKQSILPNGTSASDFDNFINQVRNQSSYVESQLQKASEVAIDMPGPNKESKETNASQKGVQVAIDVNQIVPSMSNPNNAANASDVVITIHEETASIEAKSNGMTLSAKS